MDLCMGGCVRAHVCVCVCVCVCVRTRVARVNVSECVCTGGWEVGGGGGGGGLYYRICACDVFVCLFVLPSITPAII